MTVLSGGVLLQQTGCTADLQVLASQLVAGFLSSIVNQFIAAAISSWLGVGGLTTGGLGAGLL